jgi:uncharacterized protein (TIGR03083 family)
MSRNANGGYPSAIGASCAATRRVQTRLRLSPEHHVGVTGGSERRVRPDDLVHAAELAAAALAPHDQDDWSARAGDLGWDIEATVVHFIGALAKETLYLASRSTRFIAVNPGKSRGATPVELVRSIVPAAQALANTANASPPGAMAYHGTGMTDAEGYLAMGCGEVLVHTWDACRGLGVEFGGSDEVAARVLGRTFPWVEAQPNDGPWRTMLWAFGRIPLEGRPRLDGDGLPGVREPLADWDGTPPSPRRTDVVEWVLDQPGGWHAVYRA